MGTIQASDLSATRIGHPWPLGASVTRRGVNFSVVAPLATRIELLIFADDVQCAHGNTIGALDESALFYAQQRGMPFETARAMLTQAFVGEVVDRIEHEGAREIAAAWVAEQLGRGE